MSDPFESPLNDLFNFPEVEGLEEFGLVPPIPASMRAAEAGAEPTATTAAPASGPSSASSETSGVEAESVAAPVAKNSARPNPPTPEGVVDLDEDLFHFDELFSLDDDPYHNGTLNSDGLPANDLFLDPTPAAPAVAEPAPAAAAPTPAQPAPAPQADAQPVAQAQPLAQPQPQPQAQVPQPPAAAPQSQPRAAQPQAARPSQPQTDAYSAPLPSSFPTHRLDDGAMAGATAAGNGNGYALRDRGPRILLPEDIPYSQASEKQRLLWILVACFLLVNTGIFYVATQASAAFQSSLQVTTDKLADAIAQDKATPAPAPPSQFPATSASVGIDPTVTHTVSTQPTLPAGSDLPERSQRDRWIDPRDYANTHEFAVGNAKALLAEGRFEDARRLLNHVLANQARIPLSPVLREEIDYLIPLTYFEQGNATAPTPEKRP